MLRPFSQSSSLSYARYRHADPTNDGGIVAGFEPQRPEQVQFSFNQATAANTARVNMAYLGAAAQGGYESLLARAFFSPENINDLQVQLANEVYRAFQKRCNPQDLHALCGDMAYIFAYYARHVANTDDPDVVRRTIPEMNAEVVRGCGQKILGNVSMHAYYLNTRSRLAAPSERPQSTTRDEVMIGSRFV